MQAVQVWKKNGEIHKRYLKQDLLDADWPQRVALIERFTRTQPYPTRFREEGAHLVRSMKRLPVPSPALNPADRIQILQLGAEVERMHAAGIVHGDLHPKNLLWDGRRVVIVDFEPSLRQLHGYRPCWMATHPFLHPSDLQAMRLTRLTDLMCLVHLALGLKAAECARIATTELQSSSSISSWVSRTGALPVS